MNIAQLFLGDIGITLVDAIIGAAISQIVLGRGDHIRPIEQVLPIGWPLQTANHRAGIFGNNRWVRGIALIGTAPTEILRHSHGGRKSPFLPRYANFFRGRYADLLDQRRVAHRAKANIVREQRRADDVRVTVYGVCAPDQRNAYASV